MSKWWENSVSKLIDVELEWLWKYIYFIRHGNKLYCIRRLLPKWNGWWANTMNVNGKVNKNIRTSEHNTIYSHPKPLVNRKFNYSIIRCQQNPFPCIVFSSPSSLSIKLTQTLKFNEFVVLFVGSSALAYPFLIMCALALVHVSDWGYQ